MAVFGIVCEYNPFHNGHAYLIDEARRMGAERIVCVMSGNAVQRGELAVADKYTRARIALCCGADLVLELPYPYSAASAEYFSRAAMRVLSELCDTVIFGSESGDIELLRQASAIAKKADFRENVRKRTTLGEGAASAYFGELADRGIRGLSSNDLLGIEYMRAAADAGYGLLFATVQRKGAAYSQKELGQDEYPSATAIRELMTDNGCERDALCKYMPSEAARILCEAYKNGEITDISLIDRATVAFFRLNDAHGFENIAEAGGGLINRVCSLAREYSSAKSLFEALRTKRYTDARIRRAMLFAMTGVTHTMLDTPVAYTTLLAANEKGRELLSVSRRTRTLSVITKPSTAPECTQTEVNARLDALFILARPNAGSANDMLKKGAYIE